MRKSDVDLVALREQLLARKQELPAHEKAEGLPPAEFAAVIFQPS